MTATDLLTFLLTGVFAPLLIAVINRPDWTSGRKQLVALIASVILAVVALVATGGFGAATDTATKITMVAGLASLAYSALWKPAGVTATIEAATTPGG